MNLSGNLQQISNIGDMNSKKICLKKNLNDLLQQHRLTQADLARDLGINKSTLHNYFEGAIPKAIPTLLRIADYFHISLEELLFDAKDPLPTSEKIIKVITEVRVIREEDTKT